MKRTCMGSGDCNKVSNDYPQDPTLYGGHRTRDGLRDLMTDG